jgi:hypothetical protein
VKKQRSDTSESDSSLGGAKAIERAQLASIFRKSMFLTPQRAAPSAWTEHVPFAFWLVDVLRPSTIVELGTQNGVSYSAMCQAVKFLGLPTSCFAIDTWQGDEHAGYYPEETYRDFATFHDQHYSAFSRLVRSTFDEALPHFKDQSVDLLHIDGLHTYEAVRHDFESWLPKLSPAAIVLFHDTNVRENNFGVFRLWSELTAGQAHFEFLHGHGLGVLGLGRNYSDALRFLFDANEDDHFKSSVREMFAYLGRSARLGEGVSLEQTLNKCGTELAQLNSAVAERDAKLASLNQALSARINDLADRDAKVASLNQALSASINDLAERDAKVASLNQALSESDVSAAFELVQQFLPIETRLPWLPVHTRHRCLIEHKEGRHTGADRDREIGCGDLFQIKLNHHVLGDLPALGGTVLQPLEPVLHFGDPTIEPCCQGLIGQCGPDDGCDDLVQVGQSLDRIGEGLLIDCGVFCPDALTDGAIGGGDKR